MWGHYTKSLFPKMSIAVQAHLAMQRRLWGPGTHTQVAVAMGNAASVLMALGRFNDARPLLRDALAVLQRRWGERDHIEVCVCA